MEDSSARPTALSDVMRSRCTPLFLTKLWEEHLNCLALLFKEKKKTTVFLSSSRNTNGNLGELEMLWGKWTDGWVFPVFFFFLNGSSKFPRRVFLWIESNKENIDSAVIPTWLSFMLHVWECFCLILSIIIFHCCITTLAVRAVLRR